MKFIFATGGTAGHIFPALEVASLLKNDGHEIIFMGALQLALDKIKRRGFAYEMIEVYGFSKNIFKFLVSIVKACCFAWQRLKNLKPDAVVGFGSYSSFPVVFSSILLRYPTLIHEQNVIPGKANKVLSWGVNKIAVSFAKSRDFFNSSKTIVTGCPTRVFEEPANRKEVLQKYQLRENTLTILVMGGSQGSHAVNEAFVEVSGSLKEHIDFQVIHLTGPKDFEWVKEKYERMGVNACVRIFVDAMHEIYSVADLVISRAGAVTVTELGVFHVPAILIPYPFAQGHQKENALVLCGAETAYMIEEKNLTVPVLRDRILTMHGKRWTKEEIQEKLKGIIYPDASVRVAKEVVSIAR